MPYVNKDTKERFKKLVDEINSTPIYLPGELNYLITEICQRYLYRHSDYGYVDINGVVGALDCCKMEFYRRIGCPFEDKKIIENGDAYYEPLPSTSGSTDSQSYKPVEEKKDETKT